MVQPHASPGITRLLSREGTKSFPHMPADKLTPFSVPHPSLRERGLCVAVITPSWQLPVHRELQPIPLGGKSPSYRAPQGAQESTCPVLGLRVPHDGCPTWERGPDIWKKRPHPNPKLPSYHRRKCEDWSVDAVIDVSVWWIGPSSPFL